MAFFELTGPRGAEIPVVVEVPHAGLAVPEIVADEVFAPLDAKMRDADVWVDRLYAEAPSRGAHLLATSVSRFVVDLNRAEGDIDPLAVAGGSGRSRSGRGVVWRVATDGAPVLRRPLTRARFDRRLDLFYRPYHLALRELLDDVRSRFGYVILLAAHSMPSTGRNVRGGPIVERADVVPGTLGRTTAAPSVIEVVDEVFRAAGLRVAHDMPYRGGYTTQLHGTPSRGYHAIQLELSRALYVDERTSQPTVDFEPLQEVLMSLVVALGALPRPAS